MKKYILFLLSLLVMSVSACSKNDNDTISPTVTVTPEIQSTIESFSGEIIKEGESMGKTYTDTWSFTGETTEGIITKLNMDIIRNKGTENELSKKDIMGYLMNISEAKVSMGEAETLVLDKLVANGFNDKFETGQYMITGTTNDLTMETTLNDLTFTFNYSRSASIEEVLIAFNTVFKENDINDFDGDTNIVDILPIYGIEVSDKAIGTGEGRISFSGPMGGRSYGEQIDSLVAYILSNNMTLNDVVDLLNKENRGPISERDVIAGCTINFTPEFKEVVENAMGIEPAKIGVLDVVNKEDSLNIVKVGVKGYGGQILLDIYVKEDIITSIEVIEDNESKEFGKLLTSKDSDFIKSLITNQNTIDKVDVVSGTTVTSKALIEAVQHALNILSSK